MNQHLRLTPRASPGPRTPTTRSPIKVSREDTQCLQLKRVIGSTVASSNAVSHVESKGLLAYTAGAATVLVTVDEDYNITQKVYRAKPTGTPVPATPSYFDSPTPVNATQAIRSRASVLPRELNSISVPILTPDYADSPNSRSSTVRSRTKAAASVTLSEDGRFLAVGETGYRPRILIFWLTKDPSSDTPSYAITEHSFGVKCLSFSPDGQFLASLGEVNDGFLCIWSINQRTSAATLHANNKCTSNVKAMAWMGSSVITVGTRHVKIWRVEKGGQTSPQKRFVETSFTPTSPSKALAGRNCVLGDLLDKTYTAITAIDDTRAIVCTNEGDICLVQSDDAAQTFIKLSNVGYPIQDACLIDGKWLALTCAHSVFKCLQISSLLDVDNSLDFTNAPETSKSCIDKLTNDAIALVSVHGIVIAFDSQKRIVVAGSPVVDSSVLQQQIERARLSAHGGSIKGVKSCPPGLSNDSSFITWSAEGSVMFWDDEGRSCADINVPMTYLDGEAEGFPVNELKVVDLLPQQDLLFAGDRYGHLHARHISSSLANVETTAHAGEVTAIATTRCHETTLVATAGKDRNIQLFRFKGDDFELVQTLDEHVAPINCLSFSLQGNYLLSTSSDRSLMIREAISGDIDGVKHTAFVLDRSVNLKSSPLSMHVCQEAGIDIVVVSSADKSVTTYRLVDASVLRTFKAGDDEDGDLVALNAIQQVPRSQSSYVSGVSNADKSVRIYSQTGLLVGRDYGQSEALTGIARISNDSTDCSLVSVATDGTIFIWQAMAEPTLFPSSLESANACVTSKPPLHRVLSSAELIKLKESSKMSEVPSSSGVRERSISPKRKPSRFMREGTPETQIYSPQHGGRRRRDVTRTSKDSTTTQAKKPQSRPPSPHRQATGHTLSRRLRRQSSQPVLSSVQREASGDYSSTLASATSSSLNRGSSDLVSCTQQLCKALHSYGRKLMNSDDLLPIEDVRNLERELSQTAKTLGEKAARSEAVMERLLDRYGERLVEIMERKIDEKVGKLAVHDTPGSVTGDGVANGTVH